MFKRGCEWNLMKCKIINYRFMVLLLPSLSSFVQHRLTNKNPDSPLPGQVFAQWVADKEYLLFIFFPVCQKHSMKLGVVPSIGSSLIRVVLCQHFGWLEGSIAGRWMVHQLVHLRSPCSVTAPFKWRMCWQCWLMIFWSQCLVIRCFCWYKPFNPPWKQQNKKIQLQDHNLWI